MKKKNILVMNLAKVFFMLVVCTVLSCTFSFNGGTIYASEIEDTDDFGEDEDGEQTVVAAPDDTTDVLDDDDFGADEGVTLPAPAPTPKPSTNTSNNNQSNSNSSRPATTTSKPARSSDSTLKYLAIDPGSLSPAFTPSVHDYTAVVDENVTSVKVPATPNDAGACISQVTGSKTLKPGINRITITVGASDGSYGFYHIDVAVGSAAAAELASGGSTIVSTPSPEEDSSVNTDDTEEIVGSLEEAVEPEVAETPADLYFAEDGILVYDGIAYISEERYNPTATVDLEKYNALYEQFQIEKSRFHRVVIISVVVILLLIFAIIGLALKLHETKSDDLGYDYVGTPVKEKKEKPAKEKKEKPVKEKKEKPVKEKQEKTESKKRSKLFDDDDDDLEIIDLND